MPLTNDPEELALLRGVLANPLDDAPRLILADWYDEYGHELRAEFIRLQIADPMPHDMHPFYYPAHQRWLWANLTPNEPQTWLESLQGSVSSFRRGFLAVVHCPHLDWEKHAAAILAEHPIEVVELTSLPPVNRIDNDLYGMVIGGIETCTPRADALQYHWERQWTASRSWLRFVRPASVSVSGSHGMIYRDGEPLHLVNWSITIPPIVPIQPQEVVTNRIRRRRFLPR